MAEASRWVGWSLDGEVWVHRVGVNGVDLLGQRVGSGSIVWV